jgi:hypothetical protein
MELGAAPQVRVLAKRLRYGFLNDRNALERTDNSLGLMD